MKVEPCLHFPSESGKELTLYPNISATARPAPKAEEAKDKRALQVVIDRDDLWENKPKYPQDMLLQPVLLLCTLAFSIRVKSWLMLITLPSSSMSVTH